MCFSSGSMRIGCVSPDELIGSNVEHMAIEQLAVGCLWGSSHLRV